jgi:hypothetical protein
VKAETKRVYIDSNILSIWLLVKEAGRRRLRLNPRGKKSKILLDDIKNGRYKCQFLTSEWAIAELVQSVRDRAIAEIFLLDGNEMAAFNRVKTQYRIPKSKRTVMH